MAIVYQTRIDTQRAIKESWRVAYLKDGTLYIGVLRWGCGVKEALFIGAAVGKGALTAVVSRDDVFIPQEDN